MMLPSRRRVLTAAAGGVGAGAAAWLSGCARGLHSPPEPVLETDDPSTSSAPAGEPPRAANIAASALDFPELAGLTADVIAPDAAELEARRESARELARARGCAGLVVEAGVNLSYLTAVRWGVSERPLLVALLADGGEIWSPPAFEVGTLRGKGIRDAKVSAWQEDESPFEALTRALPRGRGAWAIDPTMRAFVVEGLRTALGPRARVDSALFDELRIVKRPAELSLLRAANRATIRALEAAARRLRPGMDEAAFRPVVHAALRAVGLTDTWALVLFGPNAAYPHGTETSHTLAEGEFALIDAGGALHGYQSDITRTFCLGRAPEELQRAFDTVRAAQAAALAEMRPGAPCDRADAAAREVIAKAGWGERYTALTHRLGHGIGVQGHEPPYLRPANEMKLREGMTMSNEPGIYVPGRFGVRLEDIVAITSGDPEVFGTLATRPDID